jgi:DNA ligase D-like protein (predicted 3'-phosphoesterase)
LKSWVLRKPIPLSPGVRRLAIQVEDHDLAFGDFEGEIPRGEYGAGKIRIWDRGTFVASRWDDDRISFRISGRKLFGAYTLMRFRRAGENRWLLIAYPAAVWCGQTSGWTSPCGSAILKMTFSWLLIGE